MLISLAQFRKDSGGTEARLLCWARDYCVMQSILGFGASRPSMFSLLFTPGGVADEEYFVEVFGRRFVLYRREVMLFKPDFQGGGK